MFNMKSQGGALVESVSPGSPADKAGIKGGTRTVTVQGQQFVIGGDVIVKADNTEIKSADDLIAFLGTKKPGDTITVTVRTRRQDPGSQGHARGTSEQPLTDGGAAPSPGAAPPPLPAASHFFG